MNELIVVHANPRKKRRSAAQKAATAKMLAANRKKRRGPGRPRVAKAKRKYTRRNSVQRVVAKVRKYSRSRRTRALTMSGVVPMIKGAGIGAAGAIGNDFAYGFAAKFLPDNMKNPNGADGPNYLYHLGKGATAIALGMVAGKVIAKPLANKLAEGALTVALYEAGKTMIPANMMPLAGMGYPSPAQISRRGNVRLLSQYVNRPVAIAASGDTAARSREMRGVGQYVQR